MNSTVGVEHARLGTFGPDEGTMTGNYLHHDVTIGLICVLVITCVHIEVSTCVCVFM